MRYGMNPHQPASIVAGHGPTVVNGEPSMINYLDALNAFELVREADEAAAGGLLSAYVRARDADPKSSFGDVVALSRPIDLATAESCARSSATR
jgi:phosphoribosylaminoimidazolecarboxamide formyltransferase / IMP cyclohydrolase